MNLSGQKILITGASRGIGKACAERCAVEGARIVLVARNQETLNSVRDALPGEGHIAIPADLLKPESCIRLGDLARFPSFDLVCVRVADGACV